MLEPMRVAGVASRFLSLVLFNHSKKSNSGQNVREVCDDGRSNGKHSYKNRLFTDQAKQHFVLEE